MRLSTVTRAALLLTICIAAYACPAQVPVLHSMAIQDNRLMDLFGNYPATGPAGLNGSFYMFNSSQGQVLLSLTFDTPSGQHTVGGAGLIKGKGTEGAAFKIKGKTEEGYSLKLTGIYERTGIGRFVVAGKVKGPDVNADVSATIVPSDNSRGYIIDNRQQIQSGFKWTATHPAYNGDITSPHFTQLEGPSQFIVEESNLGLMINGTIENNGGQLIWVRGANPVTLRQGKTKLKIPQTSITIVIDGLV